MSKEVFRRAQEELARRSNLYSGKRKQNKRVHLGKYALSGIVFCSHCEDILEGSNGIVEEVNQLCGDASLE